MNGLRIPNQSLAMGTVAAAVIIVCLFKLLTPQPVAPVPLRTKTARVKRVISGNIIKLKGGERVRYAGIRAPFRREPLGNDAFERNRELVEGGKIRMRFDQQQKDKHGRWIAYVFVHGKMINQRLVEEGLAYVRLKATERRFAKELLAAQRDARKAHRGIWKDPIVSDEERYPADRKHGVFHRPDCADVTSTRPGNEIIFKTKQEALDAGFSPCGHCLP